MCCVLAGVILHTDAGRLHNVSADEHSTAAVLQYVGLLVVFPVVLPVGGMLKLLLQPHMVTYSH